VEDASVIDVAQALIIFFPVSPATPVNPANPPANQSFNSAPRAIPVHASDHCCANMGWLSIVGSFYSANRCENCLNFFNAT
jgi:hypothetical protein